MFKEDFQTERRDRERAAGEYDDDRRRMRAENEDLSGQLRFEKASRIRLENELKQLKLVNTTPFNTQYCILLTH